MTDDQRHKPGDKFGHGDRHSGKPGPGKWHGKPQGDRPAGDRPGGPRPGGFAGGPRPYEPRPGGFSGAPRPFSPRPGGPRPGGFAGGPRPYAPHPDAPRYDEPRQDAPRYDAPRPGGFSGGPRPFSPRPFSPRPFSPRPAAPRPAAPRPAAPRPAAPRFDGPDPDNAPRFDGPRSEGQSPQGPSVGGFGGPRPFSPRPFSPRPGGPRPGGFSGGPRPFTPRPGGPQPGGPRPGGFGGPRPFTPRPFTPRPFTPRPFTPRPQDEVPEGGQPPRDAAPRNGDAAPRNQSQPYPAPRPQRSGFGFGGRQEAPSPGDAPEAFDGASGVSEAFGEPFDREVGTPSSEPTADNSGDVTAPEPSQSFDSPESSEATQPLPPPGPAQTNEQRFVPRPPRQDFRRNGPGFVPGRRPYGPPGASSAFRPRPQVTPSAEGLMGENEELIAGRHPVEEAFVARRKAHRLLVVPQRRLALEKLVLHATNLRIPIIEVEGGTLTSLAGFDGHQGIALVTDKRQFATVDDLLARAIERKEPAFVLVLDSLEDPQNFGTLLRTAEAAGVHGVIYPTHRQAPLSAAAIKASAGAVEHLLLVPVDDLPDALAGLHVRGLRVIGTDADAPLTARQTDLRGPVVIVVGSEGQGLGPAVRRRCDAVVRIPMRGHVESLNAAVAGSILLYEASSQRGGDRTLLPSEPTTQVDAISYEGLVDEPAEPTEAEPNKAEIAPEVMPEMSESQAAQLEPAKAEVEPETAESDSAPAEPQPSDKPAPRKRAKAAAKAEASEAAPATHDAPTTHDAPAPHDELLPGGPAVSPSGDLSSGD